MYGNGLLLPWVVLCTGVYNIKAWWKDHFLTYKLYLIFFKKRQERKMELEPIPSAQSHQFSMWLLATQIHRGITKQGHGSSSFDRGMILKARCFSFNFIFLLYLALVIGL